MAKAEYYLQAKRYRRAVEASHEVIAIQPNVARAYMLRGSAYNELREFDSALRAFDEVIRLDPSRSGPAYSIRAGIYTELGDYDQAIENAEIGLTAAVLAYQNRGSREEVVKQDLAAAVSGLAGAFFRSGKYGDYSSHFRDHLRSIEGFTGNSERIAYDGPYERALDSAQDEISAIDTKLILEPNKYGLYLERGQIYADIGWYEKAIEDYNKGDEVQRASGVGDGYVNFRGIEPNIQLKQYDEAYPLIKTLEEFSRSLDEPGNPVTHGRPASSLALLYLNTGHPEEALRVMNAYDIGNFETDLGFATYVGRKSIILAVNGEFDEAAMYFDALYCDAEVRQCTYPAELAEAGFQGWSRSWYKGSSPAAFGLSHWMMSILDDFNAGTDELGAHRYLSRLLLYGPFPSFGYDRIDSSQALLVLDPQSSDAFLNLALAHFEFATAEIRNARNDATARPMELHYQKGMDALDKYETFEGPNNAWMAELRLAEVHRTLALQHMSAIPKADQDYQQKHLGLSIGAFASYERLGGVDEKFAGDYYFRLGNVFAGLGSNQEAQNAYKTAFDYGYDRQKIEEALSRLVQQ